MTGDGNNTYLLVGSDSRGTLIDAGVGHVAHLAEIQQHLTDAGASLSSVLVTHGHPDHAAGAQALARAHAGAHFQKYPWPEADAKYDVPWRLIRDGDRIPVAGEWLTALHTPGHSPDHLAFWHEDSRTIFSGDLVIKGATVMIHASGGGDLGQYLESLSRIRALKPDTLLPAHGPAITDPEAEIAAYVRHRLLREAQVIAAIGAGRETVESIAESLYDGLAPALMPAARETVRAHLDKLKKERRAFEEHARWYT